MSVLEKIESASSERSKQLGYSEEMGNLQSSKTIYGHVNEHIEENISNTLREIYNALILYNESENLPNDVAIENMAKEFRKSIKDAKKNKIMFSVPCHIDVFLEGEKLSVIDYLMLVLQHLMESDANVTETGKSKLRPFWLEMSDLVSKGNDISTRVSKILPSDILQKREDYLSNLKQIVRGGIEKNKEKDVIKGVTVERDNGFYYVRCPEESVVVPAKFLNNPEFQGLDGALKIGKRDNIIRIQNGQYCDMKGVLQMTFPVGEKKIEMILSSENTSGFGKIMVYIDDKNCEIFSKYCEELAKEPRISKVIEAAKGFVQAKKSEVSPPSFALEKVSESQHSQSNGQELPGN